MNQILYEKLVQYILTNQERFYRLAYSYTKNHFDADADHLDQAH